MRQKVEGENEWANGSTINQLKDQKDRLAHENQLQKDRIDQLNKDFKNLSEEFTRFRNEKQQ